MNYSEKRDRIIADLPAYVDERRIPHVLGVEKEALNIASLLGLDGDRTAYLSFAALLHDITKKWSKDDHLDYLKKRGIEYDGEYALSPKTLHELTGGYYADELYPEVTALSPMITDCISNHTTGSHGDDQLYQRIIFLADFIEETRTFPECTELREYFYSLTKKENAEDAILHTYLKALETTVSELEESGQHIHKKTLSALCAVKSEIKGKKEMENNEQNEILKAEALAKKIVTILDAHKAGNIKLLKVTEKTVIADYFVICSGSTNTQVRGICDEVEYKLGLENVSPVREEGLDTCSWCVQDYSSVILHVFNTETRKYYNLERLWAEAEEVDISSILTED